MLARGRKETHMKPECTLCFDRFITHSGRIYCNACTEHIKQCILQMMAGADGNCRRCRFGDENGKTHPAEPPK